MIFEKVRIIICDLFGTEKDDITPETSFYDLDADELDMVDIAMSLEDDFNTEITDEVLEKFNTVGDIVKYLEEVL